MGVQEGEDDVEGATADADMEEEEEEEEEDTTPDSLEEEEEEEEEVEEEEEEVQSDPDAYDSDGPACAVLPIRSAIKCNDALEAALPGIIDFRNSDFEVTRRLAFS